VAGKFPRLVRIRSHEDRIGAGGAFGFASCHGADARGADPLAGQLRRLPPDLTEFSARNGGTFPSERLRRIIDGRDVRSHGDREMPVWGDAFKRTRGHLSDEDIKARIDAIVRYLEAIQQRSA